MSEQENHSGRWISTSAASETKAPHSSDYAHYPRLNPSDITPPMHAPISGATATIFCLSSSLTTPELDFKRMWSGNCWSTKHLLSFNGGRMNTVTNSMATTTTVSPNEFITTYIKWPGPAYCFI
ncbi:hypothetical protein Bca4012_089958 [Brassica carinata]